MTDGTPFPAGVKLPAHDHPKGEQVTYVLRAADGAALYVGVTADFTARLKNHRYTKPWWPDVTSVDTVAWVDDWKAAEVHERALIEALSPTHNSPNAWATGRRNWDLCQ